MNNKIFRIKKEDIKKVISPMGGCYASDMITVEGLPVKYMYREEGNFEKDSGWRFLSGTESQEYLDNPENLMIYDVNTIANYDPSIIPYLNAEIGSEFIREGNVFKRV
ncbi:DUF2185 domain-containing protein [Niabella drilacis]|uniref:Immunity protein Imm33 domain-containing protein n=1 Tax=Niabella drilacis (strain DSM 25811 / CCM 8410 / CCUG 62505 / LMG 26954 / E90) TaxID=1285928 RepID=A0A1G6ZFR7_NIADE|nr:DUF2185 domain-containing protein [Niabella drilacis]SDE00695.1 hypothetical protein SAMN04487894_1187 [Niabella drilacis]